uniref:Uncharacterized protein n=1 Tax=Oryza meridionalis TaxID=40149 RepID=A0A0E0EA38_9ORYZ
MPGQPSVPVGRPRHGPAVGPGQHEPDPSRAVLCLSRAKMPCRGPGLQASGLMAIYAPKAWVPGRMHQELPCHKNHVQICEQESGLRSKGLGQWQPCDEFTKTTTVPPYNSKNSWCCGEAPCVCRSDECTK